MTLTEFQTAMGQVSTKVYHHFAPPNAGVPRAIWAEYFRQDMPGDNTNNESKWLIAIEVYVKTNTDSIIATLESKLKLIECAWFIDQIQYESDTGLLHYTYHVSILG